MHYCMVWLSLCICQTCVGFMEILAEIKLILRLLELVYKLNQIYFLIYIIKLLHVYIFKKLTASNIYKRLSKEIMSQAEAYAENN